MTDVCVRQQDRVGKAAQSIDLPGEIRGRVDHEAAAGAVVDQAERRHELTLRGVAARFDAQRLLATEVGHSAVLGNPEDDGLDPGCPSRMLPRCAEDYQENRRNDPHGRILSDFGRHGNCSLSSTGGEHHVA
jgi:hypothetical protein